MTKPIIIGQWNCASLNKQHKDQINALLTDFEYDIFCINETWLCKKTTDEDLKKYFEEKYNIIRKDRNCQGGGVATLIRKDIVYEKIDLDNFNLELVAIKVTFGKSQFNLINIYIPSRKCKECMPYLSNEFFQKLNDLKIPYIMCGDLNGHHYQSKGIATEMDMEKLNLGNNRDG